jgi:hypothetical protein
MPNNFGSQNVGAGWGPPAGYLEAMSQAGSKMARGFAALGEGLAEARKNKEEAQGLDMAGDMLAKAFLGSDLPLPENWQKYSAMSAGAKKAFLGEAWKTLAVTTQQKEASNQQKEREQRMALAQATGARDAAAEGRLAGADAARQRFSQAMGRGVPETMSSPSTTPGGMLDRSGAFPPIRYNRNLTGPETLNASAAAGESPDDQYRRAMAQRYMMEGQGQDDLSPNWLQDPKSGMRFLGRGRTTLPSGQDPAIAATNLPEVPGYTPAPTGRGGYTWLKTPSGAVDVDANIRILKMQQDAILKDYGLPLDARTAKLAQIEQVMEELRRGGSGSGSGATSTNAPAGAARFKILGTQ